MNNLTVYFAAMGNIENFYEPLFVANRIDYSIISDTQTIIRGVAQFLTAKRTGITLVHWARCALRSSCRKFLRLREASLLRVSAIVRSMISSLRWELCINPANIALCSGLDNARNAVRKTSALAWTIVIGKSPFGNNFITVDEICQGAGQGLEKMAAVPIYEVKNELAD